MVTNLRFLPFHKFFRLQIRVPCWHIVLQLNTLEVFAIFGFPVLTTNKTCLSYINAKVPAFFDKWARKDDAHLQNTVKSHGKFLQIHKKNSVYKLFFKSLQIHFSVARLCHMAMTCDQVLVASVSPLIFKRLSNQKQLNPIWHGRGAS